MKVSICVVAYNEEKLLNNLLNDIKNQDYPHNKIEVILVDSMSTDKTRKHMRDFQKDAVDFQRVQVLENPKRNLASGWNVALKHYQGDIIIRVDAHASIPFDFVKKNVEILKHNEYVSGGPRPNIIDEENSWREILLLAEQSMFGSGIAVYRHSTKKSYVKSVFHGAYKREVFEKSGFFNEGLGRTEDNEFHYRIRKAGYKICYSPDIVSYQHTRSTLLKMMKQKYGNGYWVMLTLKVCPGCLEIYHFIPFLFVVIIIITAVLGAMGYPLLARLFWSVYGALAVIMSFFATRRQKKCIWQILLPFIFLLLHLSYGVGSLAGLFRLPFWKCKTDDEME